MLLGMHCRRWLLAVLTVIGAGLAVDGRPSKLLSWSAQKLADGGSTTRSHMRHDRKRLTLA